MRFSKRILCPKRLDSINRGMQKKLDKNGFSGILMIDLSKAFD